MRRFGLLFLVPVLATLAAAGASPPPAADGLAATGQALAARECASCHSLTLAAGEDLRSLAQSRGPDLSFAGSKFRREWMESWLQAPRRIRPAGYLPFRYTVSTPNGDRIASSLLPAHPRLEAAEARAVAAYLASLKQEINPFPKASPNDTIRAEVHFGKILACGGCHQARPGQGGISGPELYTAGERLSREWALSFISDPVYWRKTPMPRINMRSDQLAALGDYLFTAPAAPVAEPALGKMAVGQPGEVAAPSRDRGEALYQVLCSQCHGIRGDGKGINAPSLFISPRDHTSYDEMSALTDERIFSAIKRGGPAVGKSALMPSWGAVLNDEEIRLLVTHLRRLSGTAAH